MAVPNPPAPQPTAAPEPMVPPDPSPKGRKPTKRERRSRLNETLDLRLHGAEWWNIRDYFAHHRPTDKGPLVLLGRSTIFRYLQWCDELLADGLRATRERIVNRHIAMRRYLYASAVAKGDERAALAVLDSEAKLMGLYPKPTTAMSDDELQAELDRLADEMPSRTPAPHGERHP